MATIMQDNTMNLEELMDAARICNQADELVFQKYRKEAFEVVNKIYDERSGSYNHAQGPMMELIFGPVSLASVIFQKAKRLTSILWPSSSRRFVKNDLNKLMDSAIDLMNFGSWMYSICHMAANKNEVKFHDETPDYVGRSDGTLKKEEIKGGVLDVRFDPKLYENLPLVIVVEAVMCTTIRPGSGREADTLDEFIDVVGPSRTVEDWEIVEKPTPCPVSKGRWHYKIKCSAKRGDKNR